MEVDYGVMRAFLWSGIIVVISVGVAGAWLMGYIPHLHQR
jgi:hypothetical protein